MVYRLPANLTQHPWIVYGSELSPFTLKLLNYLSFYQLPHQFYFTQGNPWQNINTQLKRLLLTKRLKKLTWPPMSENDEFPLVPFLFGPEGEALYDSSAIAEWLEFHSGLSLKHSLFPNRHDNPRLDFLQHLIDEFFDDWGLYLVHHNRWKVACIDNNAGHRLAKEIAKAIGPLSIPADRSFSDRQTRRLPYLFSVAPTGFRIDGAKRQPPEHLDFPPTYDLLEESFSNILQAIEPIFSQRPFLFGDSYTLADASLYGQLAMNLADPSAAEWIATAAPSAYKWLNKLAALDFSDHIDASATWQEDLKPLFNEISQIYLPLMNQNEQAFERFRQQGQRLFNEEAFWKNEAIFEGKIDGTPFKSVAKSFQVSTWRAIKKKYQALGPDDKAFISQLMKNSSLLENR